MAKRKQILTLHRSDGTASFHTSCPVWLLIHDDGKHRQYSVYAKEREARQLAADCHATCEQVYLYL